MNWTRGAGAGSSGQHGQPDVRPDQVGEQRADQHAADRAGHPQRAGETVRDDVWPAGVDRD
jgi:hypothetical protein